MLDTSALGNHALDLLQTVLTAILSNPTQLITWLQKLIQRILGLKAQEGMYEVLEHDAQLELLDATGQHVTYSKRQKVRFLQDNIIAYQDQAWGDGEIFAAYKCSPGVPVDRYREGNRYRILISLRETKHRGDVEEFLIERRIEQGFKRPTEDLQTDIDHETRSLSVTVIFPKDRWAREVRMLEQKVDRSTRLDPTHFHELPDGRQRVQWSTKSPKRFEVYILRWQW